jgi:hypothetical protein
MAGLLPLSGGFAGLFQPELRITGKFPQPERKISREKPIAKNKPTPILLLVGNTQTRDYLYCLLTENNYFPLLMTDSEELLDALETVCHHLDQCSAGLYGIRILSRLRFLASVAASLFSAIRLPL